MIKKFQNFLTEGAIENNKLDDLLDKGLENLSDKEKDLLNFLGKGGLLKDYKYKDVVKVRQNTNRGELDDNKGSKNLTRNQQEVVDYYMEDYNIDLTHGWFIFCLENDIELQEERYDHTIYIFPAEDPWFDQQSEAEEFFPYELDPEPRMLAEARYGYDGNFEQLKRKLESTGFFEFVPIDDREEFNRKHNGR